MTITINGRTAAVRQSIEFEYVAQNRLFSDSGDHTLAIDLPLKDCPENQAIFGFLLDHRVRIDNVYLDCTIQSGNFRRNGLASIISVDESEVRIQFVEGRLSEKGRPVSLDDLCIFDMHLSVDRNYSDPRWTPYDAWLSYDRQVERQSEKVDRPDINHPHNWRRPAVALPWMNNRSGVGHNNFTSSAGGFVWADGLDSAPLDSYPFLCWMPYLITLAEMIAEAADLDYDFEEWRRSPLRNLVVCNTRGYSSNISLSLPKWSVREFFNNIAPVLGGTFRIDEEARTVEFVSYGRAATGAVVLRDVEDSFTRDVSDSSLATANYLGAKNLKYADRGDAEWKFESCRWFVENYPDVMRREFSGMDSFRSFINEVNLENEARLERLYHVAEGDRYFILRRFVSTGGVSRIAAQEVNRFGPRVLVDDDDAESFELKVLPVRIDEALFKMMIFLEPSEDSGDAGDDSKTPATIRLEAGDKSKPAAVYSTLMIGYWPGIDKLGNGLQIVPSVDIPEFSMRLTSEDCVFNDLRTITPGVKFTFGFLSDEFPDVDSVFVVDGVGYLCASLTSRFTSSGRSRRIEGEFYRLD